MFVEVPAVIEVEQGVEISLIKYKQGLNRHRKCSLPLKKDWDAGPGRLVISDLDRNFRSLHNEKERMESTRLCTTSVDMIPELYRAEDCLFPQLKVLYILSYMPDQKL